MFGKEELKMIGLGFLMLIGMVIIGAMWSGAYSVDQGERAIVLRFGKVVTVEDPGLHFKIPYVEKTVKISTRTNTAVYPNVPVYSQDQQAATLTLSIIYSIKEDMVEDLYTNQKSIENMQETILSSVAFNALKSKFGQFTAMRAIQHREDLVHAVYTGIKDNLKSYPYIDLKSIQIENIDYSDAYEETIEERMKAEIEVERIKQNWEREKVNASIIQTQAKAQSDALIEKARGESESIKLKAMAESEAIRVKGEQLSKYPNVLQLSYIDKWDGVVPKVSLGKDSIYPTIPVEKYIEEVTE